MSETGAKPFFQFGDRKFRFRCFVNEFQFNAQRHPYLPEIIYDIVQQIPQRRRKQWQFDLALLTTLATTDNPTAARAAIRSLEHNQKRFTTLIILGGIFLLPMVESALKGFGVLVVGSLAALAYNFIPLILLKRQEKQKKKIFQQYSQH